MPTIETRVVTEQLPNRAGSLLAAETAPVLRGDGDISYSCGQCSAILVENVSEGDIRSFHILCPDCGSTCFLEAKGA